MLEARSQEAAKRRRVRVAGPGEVEGAWDGLMRPARRPPLWRIILQELCVLIAGGALSAAGGVFWFTEMGGGGFAAALAVAAVMAGLAATALRVHG